MRRLSRQGLAWLALAGALLPGSPAGVAAQTPRAGREFEVKVGRVVTLDGGGLRVRLARVESDSRCPVDVNCVWAGNAEVVFEVGARGRRGVTTLRLNTSASPERPGEGRFGRYTLRLVGLAPRPRGNRKIAAGRYAATLLVVRE